LKNYNYFLLYLCILSNFHLLNLIYTFDYINFFVFNFISELLDILVLVSYLSAHNNPFTLMYPFNLDLIQIKYLDTVNELTIKTRNYNNELFITFNDYT